jgi:glycosyltransferase involved in cell wall biosynthesis
VAADLERARPVAILHPPGYIGVNPTMESMISFLAERGHDIHLISLERPRDEAARFTSHALRAKHLWLATRWGRPFSRVWMPVFAWLEVRRIGAGAAIIAVDTAGALAAIVTVRLADARHVFLSLHMETPSDVVQQRRYGAVMRVLIARRVVRRMAAVITQDDHRRQQLQEEDGLAGRSLRWFIVPNSHRGPARRYTSTFYQDRLGLPPDEPVVLVAGSIGADWSHTEFLADCARRQDPPFYTLVMQSREPLGAAELRKLSALCHSRAVLSSEPVAFADLGRAFSSATVGAAIYTSTFYSNQKFVGGASGKMMSYLQAGVPVIMLDSPGVTEVIREFGCGEVLSRLDHQEFNSLVRKIASARDGYATNAERCYNERYEFDRAFSAVHGFMSGQERPT